MKGRTNLIVKGLLASSFATALVWSISVEIIHLLGAIAWSGGAATVLTMW